MPIRLHIPDDLQHPAHHGPPPDPVRPEGLAFAAPSAAAHWVVRLTWRDAAGARTHGTAFLLNVPGATHAVLLTAAHNLVGPGPDFAPVADLVAHLPRTRTEPGADGAPRTYVVHEPHAVAARAVHVAAAYRARGPGPATDWGAVLLPRGAAPGGGFGYSVRLAGEDYLRGELTVVGYRADAADGAPKASTGVCVSCYDEQLEYRVKTEQGLSGSPVWCEYRGSPTVVGIHNARPAEGGRAANPRATKGSRGARITLDLLREVFELVGVGRKNVQLRAKEPPKPKGAAANSSNQSIPRMPASGLFLRLNDAYEFARVKLGSGSQFDVLPVLSTSGEDSSIVTLAMLYGTKWVYFNGPRREVKLTDKLTEACLFTEQNIKSKRQAMRIVTAARDVEKYQLRIQGHRIREFDGDDAESSEVSLVPYPGGSDESFTEFWFV